MKLSEFLLSLSLLGTSTAIAYVAYQPNGLREWVARLFQTISKSIMLSLIQGQSKAKQPTEKAPERDQHKPEGVKVVSKSFFQSSISGYHLNAPSEEEQFELFNALGVEIGTFTQHRKSITGCQIYGDFIITTSLDGYIGFWNLQVGTLCSSIEVGKKILHLSEKFSNHASNALFLTSLDNEVVQWDFAFLKDSNPKKTIGVCPQKRYVFHHQPISAMKVWQKFQWQDPSEGSNAIFEDRFENNSHLPPPFPHQNRPTSHFLNFALVGAEDGTLSKWNLNEEAFILKLDHRTNEGENNCKILCLEVWENGAKAASAASDKTLMIWNLMTGERVSRFVFGSRPSSISWIPNSYLLISQYHSDLLFLDIESEETFPLNSGHSYRVTGAKLLSDINHEIGADQQIPNLVTWGWDQKVIISHLEATKQTITSSTKQVITSSPKQTSHSNTPFSITILRRLHFHSNIVHNVIYDIEKKLLVTCSDDQTCCVYDMKADSIQAKIPKKFL